MPLASGGMPSARLNFWPPLKLFPLPCPLSCGRWAGTEDLNARLLVLAGGWGGGDDTPDLLSCATGAPLKGVSAGSALASSAARFYSSLLL